MVMVYQMVMTTVLTYLMPIKRIQITTNMVNCLSSVLKHFKGSFKSFSLYCFVNRMHVNMEKLFISNVWFVFEYDISLFST